MSNQEAPLNLAVAQAGPRAIPAGSGWTHREQKVESLQMLLQATPTVIQQQQQQADGINNFFTADSESCSSKEIKAGEKY